MQPTQSPNGRGDVPRVLLVGDPREVLAQILADPRVSITLAPNAAAAREVAKAIEPDVIVVDARLPLVDDLTELQREQATRARMIRMRAGAAREVAAYAWLKDPYHLSDLQEAFLRPLGLPPLEPEVAPPPRARRLLIVDDEFEVRESLAQFLAHPLVEIDVAADGAAGLEKAWTMRPDAILLDVMMPKVGGFDIFVELRRARFFPRLLLMSGKAREEVFALAVELGAYACFRKPFQVEDALRETVLLALGLTEAGASESAAPVNGAPAEARAAARP